MKLVIEIDLTEEIHTLRDVGLLLHDMGRDWAKGSAAPDRYEPIDLRGPIGSNSEMFEVEADYSEGELDLSSEVDFRATVSTEPFDRKRRVVTPASTLVNGEMTQHHWDKK